MEGNEITKSEQRNKQFLIFPKELTPVRTYTSHDHIDREKLRSETQT